MATLNGMGMVRCFRKYIAIIVGIILAITVWPVDAYIDVIFFYENSFTDELFEPSLLEIYFRALVSSLIILITLIIHHFRSSQKILKEKIELIEKNKLLERQFLQSQKLEALGTFTGGIAHDFNNVLAGITGNLFLAKKKTDAPEVTTHLESIDALVTRAAEMIKSMLVFAHKGHKKNEVIDLNNLVNEFIRQFKHMLPENINIREDICEETLEIIGDSSELYQALMNLLSNSQDALKGTKNPYIELKLEKFRTEKEFINTHSDFQLGNYAHLSVIDNGSGIQKDILPYIFDPFYTTKEVGKGTGLGLSMTYGAVESMKGKVLVDNNGGVGTSFDIYIPVMNH